MDAIRKSYVFKYDCDQNKISGNKKFGVVSLVQGTAEMLAQDLGEDINDIDYLCAGINHMALSKI